MPVTVGLQVSREMLRRGRTEVESTQLILSVSGLRHPGNLERAQPVKKEDE